MIAYGAKRGRKCTARWAKDAVMAFKGDVFTGHDRALMEAAWYEYVDKKGEWATDPGHWLRGLNLRGEWADEGEWGFERVYKRLEREAARRAERERVAAGGVPKPKLERTSVGWVELGTGLVLEGVGKDATVEEAEAAWPAVWEANKAS